MKVKIIRFLLILFFFFGALFISNKVFGASTGYTITNYNVDMNVSTNNSYDITETITVNFTEEKHGIVRNIPIKNNVTRNDGSSYTNHAFITGLKVSEPYSKSSISGYTSLKIGSASRTVIGEHTYTIKYKYNIFGDDGLNDADELYFNLIGTEWDTSIQHATFSIKMPKSFDSSTLGFASGSKGSTLSSNVEYSVDGNRITGNIINPLQAREGVTIRLTLPEGYFFNIIKYLQKNYMNIVIFIGILFLARAFILWFKHGKDDPVVETVEFYPPEGYNSAEIGFIYNGEATNEAIISTLISLANYGYVKIEKDDEASKKSFKITKLKEYDGSNYVEKTFFQGLFKNGEPDPELVGKYIQSLKQNGEDKMLKFKIQQYKRILPVTTVRENDLKNKFYTTIETIKNHLNSDKDFIYVKNDSRKRKIKAMINILCFLSLCNIFIQSESFTDVKGALFVIFMQFCITKLINLFFFNRKFSVKNIILTIICVLISIRLIGLYMVPIIAQDSSVAFFYILILLGLIALAVLYVLMVKPTEKGAALLGKVKGFRKFLDTAEKSQLEALVEENPTYFYDILPYTYALGISKKWIQQFETIAIAPPDWYGSSDPFDSRDFSRMIDDTVRDVSISMLTGSVNNSSSGSSWDSSSSSSSSYSSSDSSSSSSGGGSAGGGSGGRRRKLMVNI